MQHHRIKVSTWRLRTVSVGLTFWLGALSAVAQPAPPTAICDSVERRAFDFLLGTWRVESVEGVDGGTVQVSRRADGCGLQEVWTSPSGRRGVSLNTYTPGDGSWHQTYVDNGGTVLHLKGGTVNDGMVLYDRSGLGDGRVDRFQWQPRPDGTIYQSWHRSIAELSWQPVFEAIWSRAEEARSEPRVELAESLRPLAGLLGRWEMTAIDQDESGAWRERAPTMAEVGPILDGKFLREFAELDVAAGRLEYVMLLSFDPFQKIYRMSWNDSLAGLADIYEGSIEDGVLILDNLRSETFWGSRDGTRSYAFRLEFELRTKDGVREMRVHTSEDRGMTWDLTQRTIFQKMTP